MSQSAEISFPYAKIVSLRTISRMVPLLIVALGILAPQSARAGAWTLEKGQVWSKITGLYQATDEHYGKDGEPSGFPADYTSQEVYLDVFYGVTKRFDLGVQFAAINRKFENFTATRHREMFGYRAKESGLGDIRVFGKVNLVHEPVVGTLKLGIKAPSGDFRAAPEAMSAGNGQWDVELIAQIGKSYYPIPIYANIDLGYRLRETNETIHHNPDDELIYNLEVGGSPVDRLNIALKLEGISGAGRRVTYAIPTILVSLPQGLAIEAAARVSVLGRADPKVGPPPHTYFAGSTFLLGISYTGILMQ
ncbi:MAG: hypothetical protein OYM47_09965 [Gemmatimonadota bacterium]|nr:hypothetical protein [Gemmatimonadota bacterium]